MMKTPSIDQFPQDVQDFVHELCAKAISRAIKNGTYKPKKTSEKLGSGETNKSAGPAETGEPLLGPGEGNSPIQH